MNKTYLFFYAGMITALTAVGTECSDRLRHFRCSSNTVSIDGVNRQFCTLQIQKKGERRRSTFARLYRTTHDFMRENQANRDSDGMLTCLTGGEDALEKEFTDPKLQACIAQLKEEIRRENDRVDDPVDADTCIERCKKQIADGHAPGIVLGACFCIIALLSCKEVITGLLS
jgi:hypothetical protein